MGGDHRVPQSPDDDAGTAGPGIAKAYPDAVELIGKRWTSSILEVLLAAKGPMRFTEIAQTVPPLSDRMLSERLRELEERGVVIRRVEPGPPVKVSYELTAMGRGLQPALAELKAWAGRWLCGGAKKPGRGAGAS
jgi:DNA-binding HxlR family transcriptional regulator